MLLQFKVAKDDSLWICDVQFLNFARISAPPDPTNLEASVVLEQGKLIPQGYGVYSFEGRTPKTEGPGAGLCSIGNYLVGIGPTVKVFIRANVEIKDFTMPAPIRQVLYEILPTDPNQVKQSIEAMAEPSPENPNVAGNSDPSSDPSGDLAVLAESEENRPVASDSDSIT